MSSLAHLASLLGILITELVVRGFANMLGPHPTSQSTHGRGAGFVPDSDLGLTSAGPAGSLGL